MHSSARGTALTADVTTSNAFLHPALQTVKVTTLEAAPAAEAREAETRIREARQKHQELESERAALRHKALASRAAEQVRPVPRRTPDPAHAQQCTFLTRQRKKVREINVCAEGFLADVQPPAKRTGQDSPFAMDEVIQR